MVKEGVGEGMRDVGCYNCEVMTRIELDYHIWHGPAVGTLYLTDSCMFSCQACTQWSLLMTVSIAGILSCSSKLWLAVSRY